MSMKRLGRVTIVADGNAFESFPDATINIGGISRKEMTNGHHPGHYTETLKPATVTLTVSMATGLSIKAIEAMSDVTLHCALDTGQRYVCNHAFVTDVPDFSDSDGKVKITFNGPPMDEEV